MTAAPEPVAELHPSVTDTEAGDDRSWFAEHPGRRYRTRFASGGAWVVRRRGGTMLRTFAAVLPPGLPDTDEALRQAWFTTTWPALDPRTRAELVKEARAAERSARKRR